MTQGFTTQVVSDGVWHIEDTRGGVIYLIAGSERALLIDTGWGTGDLAAHVATLTPLPFLVVNTHAHRDHVGGNSQFSEVYVHTRDLPLMPDSGARLIPVHDGYLFDLGERPVRVIGVTGHTPGSICLLDEVSRTLFTGDSPRPGPIWLHVPTAVSVHALYAGMLRLRSLWGEFDTIAPSHGLTRLFFSPAVMRTLSGSSSRGGRFALTDATTDSISSLSAKSFCFARTAIASLREQP